jgi:hypothetical protein
MARNLSQGFSEAQKKYRDYLQSDDWKEKSKQARFNANYTCEVCQKRSGLQVHHTRYRSWYDVEPPKDLICLCSSCHELAHVIFKNDFKSCRDKVLTKLRAIHRKRKRKKKQRKYKKGWQKMLQECIARNAYEINGFMVIDIQDLEEEMGLPRQ